MKLLKKIIIIVILIAIIILVLLKLIGPFPCFSHEYVVNYVSKYSKDFTLIKKESYSLGLNSLIESNETDWFFHDNELNFDFHVKTLKSEYPPKGKHISCNYYNYYIEKLINGKSEEIKNIVIDLFDEIYDLEKCNIYNNTDQIRIYIDGQQNINFSQARYIELCKIVSKKICEYIVNYKKYR